MSILRSITTLLILLSSTPALATTYEPARIGEHETSIAKRINFPDVGGNFTKFIRCEAKILKGGSIDEVGCYHDRYVDEAFYFAVDSAAQGASVIPAKVDGENVSLLMLFSVVFRQQEGERVIAVLPNHGTNAQELGMSYIAPQKYGRSNTYIPRTELGLLWIDAEMSSEGKPRKVQYLETDWSNREDKRYAKSYVKDCTFIPGHINGEPAAMRFVKPIFGFRNGFMWQRIGSKCGNSTLSCDEKSRTTGRPRFVFDD